MVVEYIRLPSRCGPRGAGYARNSALTTALLELSQGKKGLTSEPVDLMTTLRRDLSDVSPWRIGELPFAVILEMRAPAQAWSRPYDAWVARNPVLWKR